jgi:hypothetical protein
MRKVYVEVKTRLILRVNEGVEVSEVLEDMDYNFKPDINQATLEDEEIIDWNIKDSK